MDEVNVKEVYFSDYCETCVHEKVDEIEDPCDECLSVAFRKNSHRPIYYVERKA